jgi:Putative phage tail protein
MSWFSTKNSKPDFTSLQIQTATSTLPIPICWGQNKLSPNVIWYANFQTSNGSSGKGGLFSSPSVESTYAADIIMALSEGPVGGIGYIWRDQGTYTLSGLGLTFFEGSTPQSDWSYLSSTYPNQALPYQGTAYVSAASYQLGDDANVGNHNFEILGLGQSSGANGIDCDPAWWVYDFLTNAQYGAGFAAASINSASLFTSGINTASLQSYCNATGLAISPCLTTQEPASSILSRVLQQLNCAAVWSQGELKFIPYGDQPISAGNVTTSVHTGVPQPSTSSAGGTPRPQIIVCAASSWVSDGGVTYTFTGSGLTYVGASTSPSLGQYGITPNGTYVFSTADEGAAITITYTYAISSPYTPNLTPAYRLTETDFLSGGSDDPVTVSRVDPFSLPNIVRLEVLSRSNQYAGTIVEARDQSQIELYGPRVGSTITSHEICDDVTIAPIVAQTILQRGLYVRTKFTFKLGLEFCLLDPMDIVEITDSNLGLSSYPVRITSIEEDDNGDLTIEAEELVDGISTPGANPGRGVSGYKPNQAAPAEPVNANPLIYEPPPGLTNNVSQIWIGASGGSGGVADRNWGGAYVWISLDDITYTQFGSILAPLRQGVLTASLPVGSNWDATNALSASLSESAGRLTGTSVDSAQQGATLCLVDNELIAYETATLIGPNVYSLTGLARGLYGTQTAGHSTGAGFYRLDGAVLKASLPSQYIGQALYFKFQSFNVFGAGTQDLSTCVAHGYTPNGQGVIGLVAEALAAGSSLNFGTSAAVTQSEDWGDGTSAIAIRISLGAATS